MKFEKFDTFINDYFEGRPHEMKIKSTIGFLDWVSFNLGAAMAVGFVLITRLTLVSVVIGILLIAVSIVGKVLIYRAIINPSLLWTKQKFTRNRKKKEEVVEVGSDETPSTSEVSE